MSQTSSNTLLFRVTGMHCANCEVLIEERFRAVSGVISAAVSLRSSQAKVEHDGTVSIDMLRASLGDEEYKLQEGLPVQEADKQEFAFILFAALALAGLFLFLNSQGLIPDIAIPKNVSYGLAFLIGLVASVSTCMAVAGGLLLALAARYNESHAHLSPSARLAPHIFFNSGRILS